jgi:hypothetical protein
MKFLVTVTPRQLAPMPPGAIARSCPRSETG